MTLWDTFTPTFAGDPTPGHPETMTRKRKEQRKPQRLTVFFIQRQHLGRQDGGSLESTPTVQAQSNAQLGASAQNSGSSDSAHSYSPSPAYGSPAKAKFRLDGAGCIPAPSPIMDSGDDTRELYLILPYQKSACDRYCSQRHAPLTQMLLTGRYDEMHDQI